MTEETVWKIISGATLIIGFLLKVVVDVLKKDDKEKIFICPLDKSGIKGDMVRISNDLSKTETKLNDIKVGVGYNQKIIEFINQHYEKISESLNSLVNLNKEQNRLLKEISKNGN